MIGHGHTWTFSISSTIDACASTQVADDLVVGLRRRSEQDSDARAMCLRESGGTEWMDGRKGFFWGESPGCVMIFAFMFHRP